MRKDKNFFNANIDLDIIDKISKIPLFKNFSSENLVKLLDSSLCKTINLKKNDIIFNENDTYSNMCILLKGEIILSMIDDNGNRNIIDIINEPKVFAEVFSFTTNKISPVTAQSNKNSDVLIINTDSLVSIDDNSFNEDIVFIKHTLLTNLLNTFANKNLILLSKIEVISRRNIREKILHYLDLEQAKSGSKIFEVPYSRQEMADFLGVDRSALSRELSKLKDEKIIDFEKNTFKIL